MNLSEFRERLLDRLEKQDRSGAYLARQLGYSPAQFAKWLAGTNRIPYEAVVAICEWLELPPQQQVQMMDLAGYAPPRWARQSALPEAMPALAAAMQNASGIEVREFASAEEYLAHMQKCISKAEHQVEDLSWGIDVPSFSQREDDLYFAYLDAIGESCRRGVHYREVMTFRNSSHYLDRSEMLLNQEHFTYNLRTYDLDLHESPPLLAFAVIDRQEALLGWYRWPYLPPQNEKRLSIRHPVIVAMLLDYFEAIWFGATPIKDGDKIDHAQLEAIRLLWSSK